MNWIGAMLTVFASYMCGIMLSRGQAERVKTLESLLRLFLFMKLQIVTRRYPLYRIFSEFDDRLLKENGFLELIGRQKNITKTLWNEAIQLLTLDNETGNMLLSFGDGLGSVTLDEQIKQIDAASAYLSDALDRQRARLPEKQKSIRAVCLLMGLAAAIILL